MTEAYGHEPTQPPAHWTDALVQFREILECANTPTVVVPTMLLGRRPGDAAGVHGSPIFAQVAEQAFRDPERPEFDWFISYHHEGRFFSAVRRIYVDTIRQEFNG